MAEELDTSKGWCCDGRTWIEHAHANGDCCQPEGKQIADLPPEGERAARERLAQAAGSGG
jgi:hypothetical protein